MEGKWRERGKEEDGQEEIRNREREGETKIEMDRE